MSLPQGCIKRLVSESHGKINPDVWRLSGPYAHSPVPHEQCHNGLGLQRDVPGQTNCSQLCGETFIEVSLHIGMKHLYLCFSKKCFFLFVIAFNCFLCFILFIHVYVCVYIIF